MENRQNMKNIMSMILMLCSIQLIANNIESWNTLQMTTKIDNDIVVGLSEEIRIGVDQNETIKKLDEFHTTASIDFIHINHMSFGLQNDYVLLRSKSDVRYRRDNRPGINLSFYEEINGFKLLNRSRFVCRDLEHETPYFRYRNLSKIYTPMLVESYYAKDIKLFTAYEWYFDEGSKDRHIRKNDKFCQFWLDAGIHTKFLDKITFEIFYRLIENKSSIRHKWSPGHAICICASISF